MLVSSKDNLESVMMVTVMTSLIIAHVCYIVFFQCDEVRIIVGGHFTDNNLGRERLTLLPEIAA